MRRLYPRRGETERTYKRCEPILASLLIMNMQPPPTPQEKAHNECIGSGVLLFSALQFDVYPLLSPVIRRYMIGIIRLVCYAMRRGGIFSPAPQAGLSIMQDHTNSGCRAAR